MDEVLAIWSKASDTIKEFKGYVPRLTWEGSVSVRSLFTSMFMFCYVMSYIVFSGKSFILFRMFHF